MSRVICIATIILALAAMTAQAEEPIQSMEASPAKPSTHLEFEVKKDESGDLILKQLPESTESSEVDDAMKAKLQHSGEHANEIGQWYVMRDQTGEVEAIYGLGKSMQLNSGVLTAMEPGSTITKMEYKQLANDVTWITGADYGVNAQYVKDALTQMVNAAVDQVCGFRARPTQFSMDAEIKISLGIGGSVKMRMVWETSELCN